ncbi:Threonylcarbamoyladenosine tRNA methylthiotransferase [Linum perenne]
MAGQLSSFGYALSDDPDKAHLWLINTCTVKAPSQSAMDTLISKGKNAKKPLVVAGCVPQGSRNLKELDGVSIVGVQQIDRVVEVVEETLKGHEVRLLTRKTLPALDLPKTVIAEGVKEIWLSSEDTGAYGRDIGVNLPTLLNGIVAELPPDASTMLRIGMTNPPFILEHLTVVDTLTEKVPGMHIATDIICGFPGTPAARMKKVPSNIVKKRSRELTAVFEAFTPYNGMEGRIERVWITDIATDRVHLVGHTKAYVQVLIVAPESMLGASAMVKITSVGRWSVFGEVIEVVTEVDRRRYSNETPSKVKCSPCADEGESCACSGDEAAAAACGCGPEGCGEEKSSVACNNEDLSAADKNKTSVIEGLLLRKRKTNGVRKVEKPTSDLGGSGKQEEGNGEEWGLVDRVVLIGLFVSLFTVIALLIHLGSRIVSK